MRPGAASRHQVEVGDEAVLQLRADRFLTAEHCDGAVARQRLAPAVFPLQVQALAGQHDQAAEAWQSAQSLAEESGQPLYGISLKLDDLGDQEATL